MRLKDMIVNFISAQQCKIQVRNLVSNNTVLYEMFLSVLSKTLFHLVTDLASTLTVHNGSGLPILARHTHYSSIRCFAKLFYPSHAIETMVFNFFFSLLIFQICLLSQIFHVGLNFLSFQPSGSQKNNCFPSTLKTPHVGTFSRFCSRCTSSCFLSHNNPPTR